MSAEAVLNAAYALMAERASRLDENAQMFGREASHRTDLDRFLTGTGQEQQQHQHIDVDIPVDDDPDPSQEGSNVILLADWARELNAGM